MGEYYSREKRNILTMELDFAYALHAVLFVGLVAYLMLARRFQVRGKSGRLPLMSRKVFYSSFALASLSFVFLVSAATCASALPEDPSFWVMLALASLCVLALACISVYVGLKSLRDEDGKKEGGAPG